jgi:hypothetical protein
MTAVSGNAHTLQLRVGQADDWNKAADKCKFVECHGTARLQVLTNAPRPL